MEKKTILGKQGNQPFKIDATSVSRQHAEIIIDDDDNWILKDLDSTNGTYVRNESTGAFQRISSLRIHPMTFICLGPDNSQGCSFYAKQAFEYGDFSEELAYMNEKEDEYERELDKIEKISANQKWLLFLLNLLVLLATLIIPKSFDNVISDFRLNLMRIVPICSTFLAAFFDINKRRKEVLKKYDQFRHCPNPSCSRRMKSNEIRDLDCVKCHCH